MHSLAISATLLLLIAAPPLQAQDPANQVAPGDRVQLRVRADRSIVAGTVATISADSLLLNSKSRAFARSEVAQLWRRLPGSNGAGNGALVGLVAGSGIGALWGHMMCQELCEAGESGTKMVLAVGATLGGLGALTGLIVGAIAAPERWSVGTWPVGRRIGVGVSIHI